MAIEAGVDSKPLPEGYIQTENGYKIDKSGHVVGVRSTLAERADAGIEDSFIDPRDIISSKADSVVPVDLGYKGGTAEDLAPDPGLVAEFLAAPHLKVNPTSAHSVLSGTLEAVEPRDLTMLDPKRKPPESWFTRFQGRVGNLVSSLLKPIQRSTPQKA